MPSKESDQFCDEHLANPEMDNHDRVPNRLILGFDGTGNSFQGSESDTNIVKLMEMFDRSSPHQMHYYQPGIGTYSISGGVNQSLFGQIKRSVSETIDSAVATTFDAHVIAGYQFLMRYYGMGDRIYIFGFSRGAFTARFLARMISAVGLLSLGNEEMVPFAYKVYQDYELNLPTEKKATAYVETFRSTFCRHEGQIGIKVHFLGLFDTVNSVGTFDVGLTGNMKAPDVIGTAEHIRHAVAIDERRVKFKAALLAQDNRSSKSELEDSKEVWFPGNHGDIGGSWPAEAQEPEKPLGFWDRIKRVVIGAKEKQGPHTNKEKDPFQLSDIALKWMIDELDNIPPKKQTDVVKWNQNKQGFIDRFKDHRSQAIKGRMHDTLSFGGGSSLGKTLLWRLMEYLPIIRRWEFDYAKNEWHQQRWPLNTAGTRDIPPGALFHRSVIDRMRLFSDSYQPHNDISQGIKSLRNQRLRLGDVEKADDGVPYFKAITTSQRRADGDPVEEQDTLYELKYD